MGDYCKDAVALYRELAGITAMKPASTPFPPPGSLAHADECAGGIAWRDCMPSSDEGLMVGKTVTAGHSETNH